MEVQMISNGIDGNKRCFIVQDSNRKQYKIINCDLTSILNLDYAESYIGSFIDDNGTNYVAHLIICKKSKKIELELSR